MKIRQWLGYNEYSSQYLLRPGELRVLNNLQSRRPGMLLARKGLTKIYGKYNDETIYGLYRRASILGNPSDFLWLQKVLVERELTIEQLEAQESPFESVWMVRRVEGNQSRVIDTQPLSPQGLTNIANFCVAEDRHGRMYIIYGHGAKPKIYRPFSLANVALDMGLTPPLTAPSVIPSGTGYFIESVDVKLGGGSYYDPPELTISGGSPERAAKLKAVVQSGNVVGVDILDGGAGYKSTPRIEVSNDKIGTGFRAKGNISTTARVIQGFSETDSAAISGAAAAGSEETYGATNSTAGNSILYLSQPRSATAKVTANNGAVITLDSVAGISAGDTVTVYPASVPFSNSTVTVVSVDAAASTVTLSNATWTPTANTAYTATFRKAAVVAQAAATYDTEKRRFYATIPLASSSTTGSGAQATLEFSPKPLGYGLNAADSSSVSVLNKNFLTYYAQKPQDSNTFSDTNERPKPQYEWREYLYGEYWEGSEYDKAKSKENARYGGLQASGSQFVRGFSGTVDKKRADVYWPDYSKISVWFCTGVYSSNINQWRRADVAVEVETDTNTGISAKVLRFRLQPSQKAKTVRSLGGAAISTDYEEYDEFPEAVAPEVKLYLRECPDSWVNDDDQCLPTAAKEEKQNRLAWWSSSSGVSRPIVDIRPEGVDLDGDVVTITDPGRGWQKDSVFAFRLYTANPYEQKNDFNTAVVEESINKAHEFYDANNRFVEFKFTANTPDDLTPHGPPAVLITPAQVTMPGDGYTSTNTGSITLYKRGLEQTASQAVASSTLTWTAKVLETLSATSPGHIASITILSKGRNYFSPPTIEVRGGGAGYGLSVEPQVEDGRIESLRIIDPGQAYNIAPELFTNARSAQLTAVMRPAMRGKYRCAYRFADRSETVVKTVTATLGESSTTLTVSDASGIKPDMILDSPQLPHNARIKSVNGTQVEINQEISGLAKRQVIYTANGSGPEVDPVVVCSKTQTLLSGEEVFSTSGEYRVVMQTDGNLVLYQGTTALWSTNTGGNPGAYAYIGGAGRLRVDTATANLYLAPVAGADTLELSNNGTLATYSAPTTVTCLVRDLSKPIAYSDLSPITDVDAGPNDERSHCSKLTWSLPGITPPPRADMVELWRTSADQSLVYYRTEVYGIPADNGVQLVGEDTLTDEELFDPERANYAAMPIVLPNGSVNAYRFGTPRSDMSVGVAFQDRLWMGVSTSGEGANTLYYSEFDEFESLPDVNELPIQTNQKSTDVLTALVPFGSLLLAMQHSHTYAITYNTDPAVDASIQMISHRGALHQRCWDIHENVLYAADESGIYSLTRAGEVQDISVPLRDYFVSELIDFSKRETFFLQVDPKTHILRFFCCFKSVPTDTPSTALCFDIQAKSWWTETFPNSITAACTGRPADARINTALLGAVDGNLYEIAGESDHANESLTDCFVSQGGSGYREAPQITVPNCDGAVVQGVVSEGRLVDVVIQSPGWNAQWGIQLLAENGSPLQVHDGRPLQCVEYDAIKLDIGPPDPGGIQAEAYANFAVTPLIRRQCTVSEGESFVRLDPLRIVAFEPDATSELASELSLTITTEAGAPIRIETPPAEIGMEAIGDFIPLRAFVSRIDGRDVYLTHPDGTPVSMLFGAERTNQPGTSTDFAELGGTTMTVTFYKPFRTHVPFRMATGYMQLANEDNTRNGDALIDRSLTLVYSPTASDKEIEVIERFNGRDEMRPNLIRRGTGGPASFAHREDSASTVLNLSRTASHLGFSTGVAKAKFASRSHTDLTGEDQHLQVELYARPGQASPWQRTNFWNPNGDILEAQPFVMHSLAVNGVVDDGE